MKVKNKGRGHEIAANFMLESWYFNSTREVSCVATGTEGPDVFFQFMLKVTEMV